MRLGRKNKKTESIKTVQTVLRETRNNSLIFSRFAVQTRTERQLYTTLRESVPIIDADLQNYQTYRRIQNCDFIG